MGVTTIILIFGVAAFVSVAMITLAMGRVAALADAEHDELLARRLGTAGAREPSDSHTGLAGKQSRISCEPPRASVGAQRLPAGSWTSRRALSWMKAPGGGASPQG